jgi:hypothetical protein
MAAIRDFQRAPLRNYNVTNGMRLPSILILLAFVRCLIGSYVWQSAAQASERLTMLYSNDIKKTL